MPGLALCLEVAAVLLFFWAYVETGLASGPRARALVVCAVYGWALEAANMAIFGTYYYPRELYCAVLPGDVPLYIPLLWAVIIHSSMAISDRWKLNRWARPFADGLLALLIDIAVDAIAIRLGLWRWRSPSEGNRFLRWDEGWFGVPPGNLMAWMWVAASYSYFRRGVEAVRNKQPIPAFQHSRIQRVRGAWIGWELLVVLFSYIGLFAGMFASGMARRLAGIAESDQAGRLWILAGQIAAFLAIAFANKVYGLGSMVCGSGERSVSPAVDPNHTPGDVPLSYRAGRWAMHVSFAALLVVYGIGSDRPEWAAAPALLGISLGTMAIEGVIEWEERRPRGNSNSKHPTPRTQAS